MRRHDQGGDRPTTQEPAKRGLRQDFDARARAARADFEASIQRRRADFDARNEALTARTGRNLPAAIGIALAFAVVMLAALLIWKPAFMVVAAFLLVTLSSIALPGMNGFVGEFLILIGSFRWSPRLTAFAATGVILSAVYMLWMFQRVNYGPVTNEKNRSMPDLTPREWALMVPTIAMAIVMGVVPGFFMRPMEPAVTQVVERVMGAQPARVKNGIAGPAPSAAGSPPGAALRHASYPEPRPARPEAR